MFIPLWCLLAFAGWTLGIVAFGIAPIRYLAVLRGRARVSDFRADVPQGSDRYQRVMRAHVSCVENLVTGRLASRLSFFEISGTWRFGRFPWWLQDCPRFPTR